MVYENKLARFLPSMTKINDFVRIKKSRLPGAREKWRDRRFVHSKKMALVWLQRKRTQFKPWKVGIISYEDINRDAMPGFLDDHAIRGCREVFRGIFSEGG